MKNTEGVPYGRGLEVPESSVLSVVLILLAIANIVTNNYKKKLSLGTQIWILGERFLIFRSYLNF